MNAGALPRNWWRGQTRRCTRPKELGRIEYMWPSEEPERTKPPDRRSPISYENQRARIQPSIHSRPGTLRKRAVLQQAANPRDFGDSHVAKRCRAGDSIGDTFTQNSCRSQWLVDRREPTIRPSGTGLVRAPLLRLWSWLA